MTFRVFSKTLCVACFLLVGVSANAQTSQITGRITDPSQLAVAGAKVAIVNLDIGIKQEVESGALGYYTLPLLPRGRYSVSVEKSGFQIARQPGFVLDEGQVLRLDFELQIGQVAETVQVEASGKLLETETGSMSTVVTTQKINDLPLLNRNVLSLAALVPGARPVANLGGLNLSAISAFEVSFSGGATTGNSSMMDGVGADDMGYGGMIISPSVDATEEFRIITKNASAEYGHTAGGVVSFISKAGTNKLRGSLFEFVRNTLFNANNFFFNQQAAPRPPLAYNNFGLTAGGPVVLPRLYRGKDKTFFFFNWERYEQRTLGSALRTVPTSLQRQGNFSQTFNAQGQLMTVADPFTTRLDSTAPGGQLRDLFPGNIIPSSRISPVSTAVLNYYPLPNRPGLPFTQASNYFAVASTPVDKNIYGLRLDHYFSGNQRVFGRYTYDNGFSDPGNFFHSIAETNTSPINYIKHSAVIDYTDTLRPNLLFDGRLGGNRYVTPRTTRSYGFDVSTIGLPAALNTQTQLPIFPLFNITQDVSPIGAGPDDNILKANDTYTGAGTTTWVKSNHTFKFGGESRIYRGFDNQLIGGISNLTFNFSRNQTVGPNPTAAATTGNGFAAFLLGVPDSATASRQQNRTYSEHYFGLFAQDDWKITPSLTLNLGLRWEHQGAFTDRYNAFSNFDPSATYTAGGLPFLGGFTFVGVNGQPRGDRNTRWIDFGPRFGFAYQVRPKTVIRGGYGIFYGPITALGTNWANTGFTISSAMTTTFNGLTPAGNFSNPFPGGIALPTGSSGGLATGLGTSTANVGLRSLWGGYTEQWNFNIQREFAGKWLLEVGYEGNHGVSMPVNHTLRYLPQSALALGTALLTNVKNPFAGVITSGPLSVPTVQQGTLLQKYPQYTALTAYDNWGDSIYHALTVRFERRLASGLSLLTAYTYSKMIDNGVRFNTYTAGGSESVQNWDNLRAERSISSNNLPHRLVVTATYALPFGKQWKGAPKLLVAGWQLASIVTLQSGAPIAVTAPAPAYSGFRPNCVGDPTLADPAISGWLNANAFQIVAPFTYGNCGRNLPDTRTEAMRQADFSVLKDFNVHEQWRLQFRAEAYNIANHVTLGAPGTVLTSATFGIVQSASTFYTPRNLQFGLKLYF